ncbi:MAG: YicC family protein [Peptococcaceae bacterium]|nr:MAG: YicC family protein [Peptococcaceae bacterium]
MLKSMTGYGRGEAVVQEYQFIVELKAVNHRYKEVVFPRLPRPLLLLEDRIKRLILGRVARGRVDVFLSMQENPDAARTVKVDKLLAVAYYKAIKELQEITGVAGEIELEDLVNLPNIFLAGEPVIDVSEWWPAVKQAVEDATENLVQMKAAEGAELAADISRRLEVVARLNEKIKERSPLLVEEYRERLRMRLREILAGSLIDENRLACEVALLAERSDITEEAVRLASHLKQVQACLAAEEAVGRKIDFLLQEVNREVNTIASKAGDLLVGQAVVELKSELEKIREQVQNVE